MIKKIKPALLFLIHLLLLQGVNGQNSINMTDFLREKFENYIKAVPREEIYVHTDRDEYISGENLWFNVYLIDRQSSKPALDSKIAYLELLNQENRPVMQRKIWLDNGFGPGQIILPDTLSTGNYTIRAYTNWMKNFLPYNCFVKDVKIYNAFSIRTIKEIKRTKSNNNQGDIYLGLKLKVNNTHPEVIDLSVTADEKYRSENSNQFYLFMHNKGNITRISLERIADTNTLILVPKTQLLPGINHITLFNLKGHPVCERFVYTAVKETPAMTVQSADSSSLRNKISLEVKVADALTGSFNPSNFSISVTPETKRHSIMDMDEYMIFGTEFGFSPLNIFKDKEISKISPNVIDSLLDEVKSNWINWPVILTADLPEFKYPVEKEDHYLSGRLLTGDQKAGELDKYVLLTRPGKTATFQYSKTDQDGNFSFKIKIDGKVNDLVIQPDEVFKNESVNIDSPFWDQYTKSESTDSLGTQIPSYISRLSVNHQVTKIYGTSSTGEPLIPKISQSRFKRFYGKPDNELVMKDYIALPVMQEVFFELLPGVALKSKKSGYEIIMNDPLNNMAYDLTPGLFVDGVKIKDPSIIAAMDPELVEKIDVVRSKYFVGDYKFSGIINIITKTGDFSNVTLPAYAVRIPYRTIDPVVPFISPDYSSAEMKKSRRPDFRNTLYWNPSVKSDNAGKAKLEFWTCDFVSDYEINIQGITPEGKIFALKKIIKVTR